MSSTLTAPVSEPRAVTHGVPLVFETLVPSEDEPALMRLRNHEDTLLRVIDGVVRLSIEGDESVLDGGDEAIVPAGWAYTLAGIEREARVVIGYRVPQR